jgi:hypothetical protein
MDGFALVMFGVVGAVVIVLWFLGKSDSVHNSQRLSLDAREIEERRTMLEIEDEEQVREALASLRARRAERESSQQSSQGN